MATFLPIRGTQSEIDATAIVDGQLLFTTDTNNIYIDNGTTRTLYRSVSTVQLSSQNTTADAIAFGKDSSGNYGYYEAGSSELKSFKKGNATVAQVLSPYTFSNASASGLTGTMANRGSLTFNPSSSTTQSLPMGYYSGGTLSTVNAYNAGYNAGFNAKTLHKVLIGSCTSNPIPHRGEGSGSVSYSFDVSAYAQYGISADNIVLSDVRGIASARDDYNDWSNSGSVTPSFSLSGTTVSVSCPYYYSIKTWYDEQPNMGWRAFSIYSTCSVYLVYMA